VAPVLCLYLFSSLLYCTVCQVAGQNVAHSPLFARHSPKRQSSSCGLSIIARSGKMGKYLRSKKVRIARGKGDGIGQASEQNEEKMEKMMLCQGLPLAILWGGDTKGRSYCVQYSRRARVRIGPIRRMIVRFLAVCELAASCCSCYFPPVPGLGCARKKEKHHRQGYRYCFSGGGSDIMFLGWLDWMNSLRLFA
jgi:hypothetical protein